MRIFLVLLVSALLVLIVAGWWTYTSLASEPQETVRLNPEKRQALIRLREARKFEPHDYPPLGYTGIATPEEGIAARAAVNDVIDAILSRADGPVAAAIVSELIGQGMRRVDQLETEDRERTAGYMIEIWYLLGFKGSTGRFAYGAAFQRPEGYGEPLPPGWTSPTDPRPLTD